MCLVKKQLGKMEEEEESPNLSYLHIVQVTYDCVIICWHTDTHHLVLPSKLWRGTFLCYQNLWGKI